LAAKIAGTKRQTNQVQNDIKELEGVCEKKTDKGKREEQERMDVKLLKVKKKKIGEGLQKKKGSQSEWKESQPERRAENEQVGEEAMLLGRKRTLFR